MTLNEVGDVCSCVCDYNKAFFTVLLGCLIAVGILCVAVVYFYLMPREKDNDEEAAQLNMPLTVIVSNRRGTERANSGGGIGSDDGGEGIPVVTTGVSLSSSSS